jgi:hypothetical protein
MKISDIEQVLTQLSQNNVRYLIAGGFAVIAHGYNRLTMDLDLVIALDDKNLDQAIQVFENLNFRPMVPVQLKDFTNISNRKQWLEEKNMIAFSIVSPDFQNLSIDLFTEVPFDFDHEWKQAHWDHITDNCQVPFISKPTLIDMKKKSGRLKDKLDLENL